MSRAGPAAVNCPTCGAGLELIGGGRVAAVVCGYCGSELDAIEDYKVLRRFANLQRPASPFKIGMEGTLRGVPFRVIGTLAEEESGSRFFSWVSHLLYSPTHGYAWITVEDGHLVWTRRFRGTVSPSWLDSAVVEAAEQPPQVSADGESFRYYETSEARVSFVEGEFTWRPAVGDRSRTVACLGPRRMIGFVEGPREREVELSEYLPRAETLAAFGAAAEGRASGVHPLQPYAAGRDDAFLLRLAAAFAGLCLVGAVAMMGTGRQIVPPTTISAAKMPAELGIPVDQPGRLVRLDVTGDVASGWAVVELGLTDPEDRPVFVAGREVGYYTGYDEGTWVEDSRRTRLTFRPELAGTYLLEVGVEAAGLGEGDTPDGPIPAVTVAAVGGKSSPFWLLLAALLFGGVAAWKAVGPMKHNYLRWRGSDWTEED